MANRTRWEFNRAVSYVVSAQVHTYIHTFRSVTYIHTYNLLRIVLTTGLWHGSCSSPMVSMSALKGIVWWGI